VLVPPWLARRYDVGLTAGTTLGELARQAAGLALLGVGAVLFVASLRREPWRRGILPPGWSCAACIATCATR
jgi:hypothetical protein